MGKTLFVIDSKVGETVEHKTITNGKDLIEMYGMGFIVGEKLGNNGVYYFPPSLVQIDPTKEAIYICKRMFKYKPHEEPLSGILSNSVAVRSDSSVMLNVLNKLKMSEYTKKLHQEIDNQELKTEESITLTEHKKMMQEQRDKYVKTLRRLTKQRDDDVKKIKTKYQKEIDDVKTELTEAQQQEIEKIKTDYEKQIQDLKSLIKKKEGELDAAIRNYNYLDKDRIDLEEKIQGMERDREMTNQKYKAEADRMQAAIDRKTKEIELLKQQLSLYQKKEREHADRVARARENFKKNWLGKGRQPKIHGHKEEEIIISLRKQGMTIKEIAASLKRSPTTISHILELNGMTKKRGKSD